MRREAFFQVGTACTPVSELRFMDKIGEVNVEEMLAIERIVRLQLDLGNQNPPLKRLP